MLFSSDGTILYAGDTEENESEQQDASSPGDGVTLFHANGRVFCCLTVIGQIEGHFMLPANYKTTKYEHVIPKIVAVEQDENAAGLLLLLNTVGGDVEAGLALAELVAGMKKPTVSLVLGGGHSIGVPLAVAAKKSLIAASATMTVHPVRMNGLVLGVRQSFEYLQNMQERIVSFVCGHSQITPDRFRTLMLETGDLLNDLGTLLDGPRAVKEGLINGVGTLGDAVDALAALAERFYGKK